MNLDAGNISFIVGVLVSNAAVLIGFFVSLKVSIAVLDVKVGRLEKDVNNGWAKIKKEEKENET